MPLFNKKPDNRHMKAHDMFELGTIQIFCRKTGNYLGLMRHWTSEKPPESIQEETGQDEQEPEYKNPNQLNLF